MVIYWNIKTTKTMIDEKIRDDDKFVIFEVPGGHGKNVMATAVCRAIKKKYHDYKLIVVCAWDGPYFYNPDVFRFYTFGQMQYFFSDFIRPTTKIFKHEVYHSEDYILQRKHLVESWLGMYGIEPDGVKPKIILNPREVEIARDKIKPDGRPIMLLQTHGGSPQGQYSKKSWFRDMPIEIAQKLVNYFAKTYRILHIRTPEQPQLQGTELLNLPFRELYAVFPLSSKRLFIDSFAQHVATALDLQSTVVWIGNKPEVFGYEENINIMPNVEHVRELNKFSYLEQFEISGQIQQFPYDTVNMLDINKIIEGVNNQK